MGPVVFTDVLKKDLAGIGSVRANSEAGASNFLRISKCEECNLLAACLMYILIEEPEGKFITSITVDGNEVILATPIEITAANKHMILKTICERLYNNETLQQTNARVWCNFTADGSLEILDIGKLDLSISVDGAPVETVKLCNSEVVCPFILQGYEGDTILVNGEEVAIADLEAVDGIYAVESGTSTLPNGTENFVKFWAKKPVSVTDSTGAICALECGDCKTIFFPDAEEVAEGEGKRASKKSKIPEALTSNPVEDMNASELKAYASDNSIDLKGATKKADIKKEIDDYLASQEEA